MVVILRMKKILFFIDFPLNAGGSNKVILKQAVIMKQRGYQVKVVLSDDNEGRHASVYDQICQEHGLQSLRQQYHISTTMENIDIATVLADYGRLVKVIGTYGPDLIHSSQLNIAVELAARQLGIPHLMNIYQTDMDAFHIKWMNVYPRYHCADSLLFSSRWADGLGIVSECIRVPYESNCKRERNFKYEDKKQVCIVSVGVVCERKNQMEIIKFVLACKKRGKKVKLTLLGDCTRSYAKKCREFAEKNGLQREVFFEGFVTDVEHYLEGADLAIVASTSESYPGVIVECMANKVPLISTAVGGVTELVEDGENGFLATGYSSEDIYQAFLRYLDYKGTGEISRIVEKAYDTYEKYHTYAVVGEQLDAYYQWIMRDHYAGETDYLTVREVRRQFEDFVDRHDLDGNDPILMGHLWFLYHLYEVYEKSDNKKIAIWGAGHWGKITFEWIRSLGMQSQFAGFIDSAKKGRYLGELIVVAQDRVIYECGMILVAVADPKEQMKIVRYLEQCGKTRNKDYFTVCSSPDRI